MHKKRGILEGTLNKMGHRTDLAEDFESAISRFQDSSAPRLDLAVLDLIMPGIDGMGVLERMAELGIDKPVVVQTALNGIDVVVGAIRAGAIDFCAKEVSPDRWLPRNRQNHLYSGSRPASS